MVAETTSSDIVLLNENGSFNLFLKLEMIHPIGLIITSSIITEME